MENLKVFPERMQKNIDDALGTIFSQHLLLAMIGKGVMREKASKIISANAKTAMEQQTDFQYLVFQDPDMYRWGCRPAWGWHIESRDGWDRRNKHAGSAELPCPG